MKAAEIGNLYIKVPGKRGEAEARLGSWNRLSQDTDLTSVGPGREDPSSAASKLEPQAR